MTLARACVVVPSERHVERGLRGAAERGEIVETRDALRVRLLAALAPNVALANASDVRIALAEALPTVAVDDALLAPIARARGVAWLRTIDAVDAALGTLRAAAVDEPSLALRAPVAIAGRVRFLHGAMRAVDAALARAGLVDERAIGTELARVIRESDPERVRDVLGAERAVAKRLVAWDGADVAWWRALDVALRRAGGAGATVELPAIDRPLDAEREHGPLDIVADDLARALDEAPVLVAIRAPLGDLSFASPLDERAVPAVELRHAMDARAQARAATDAVRVALASGVPAESIAIALPSPNEETLGPLRVALDDAGIVATLPRAMPSRAGLAKCALDALSIASRGLGRRDVASLLRSRYVDIGALAKETSVTASALARALEETATTRADDPIAALEATARAWTGARGGDARLGALARSLGTALSSVDAPRTRADHATTARSLWSTLGIAPRVVGVASRALANDAPMWGIDRAAVAANAADARAWTAIEDALETIAQSARALNLEARVVAAESFRHELASALDVESKSAPTSSMGAIRVSPMSDLSGDANDLLVVIDANDGVLPASPDADTFASEAMATWLREREYAAPATPRVRRSRELATLAAAVSRAKRIVFVSRERDDSGGLLAPAAIVAWLARSGVSASRWSASPLAGAPQSAHEAMLRALVGGAETMHGGSIAPDATRRALIERERESLFESAAPALTEIRGALPIDAERAAMLAIETGGADRAMAVTALERIATCPFQGFASQVLHARDDAPVDERPDARDAGNLVHGALALAFPAAADLWRARPRDAETITSRAMAAADAFLDGAPSASSLRRIELERTRADVAAVVAWSIADETWDFAGAELPFGPGDGWAAVVLDDGVTRVALRGKIDRVDVAHERAAVRAIDYKSGKTSAKDAGNKIGETTFQVAIYARAAAAHHGANDIDGLYLPTRASTLATLDRSPKHLEVWKHAHEDFDGRPALDVRALRIVENLRRGQVMPAPYEESACAHCRYDGGCRKPRFAMRVDDDESEGEDA